MREQNINFAFEGKEQVRFRLERVVAFSFENELSSSVEVS